MPTPLVDAGPEDPPAEPRCSDHNGGCDPLTACTDDSGEIVCGPCPSGYTGEGATGCADIDECAIENGGCTAFETCHDALGAPPSCTDADECAVGNGGCDPRTQCTDRVADTPLCGACPAPYLGDGYTGCTLAPGALRWVDRIADPVGVPLDQYAFAVAAAPDGSGLAVAGRYDLEATFAPGRPEQRSFAGGPYDGNSVNDINAYVARYDARGRLRWAARTHDYFNQTTPNAVASFTGVAVLTDRTVVAAGYHGDVCYSPCTTILGLGEANETVLTNVFDSGGGAPEIMVARYADDGHLLWARSGDSPGYGRAYRVAALADDSIVVVGSFTSTTTLGGGEAGETTLTATAQVGGFIARYRADGALVWARQTSGDCYSLLYAVAALPAGQGVVVGGQRGLGPRGGCAVVLDQGLASEQRLGLFNEFNRIASYEPFLARLDMEGNAVWIAGMRSESGHSSSLAVHALAAGDAGTIFATGSYGPPAMYFAEGTPQATRLDGGGGSFLAAYRSDATLAWVRHVAGFTSDIGTNLALDDAGRPVMTGEFVGSETFGSGEANQTVLTAPDCYVGSYSSGGYVASYDVAGALRWARGFSCASAYSVAVLPTGPVVSVGSFWHQTTLGVGEPNATVVDDGYGGERDGIVIAFEP